MGDFIDAPASSFPGSALRLDGPFQPWHDRLDEPLRRQTEARINAALKGYTVRIGRLDFHPIGFSLDLEDLIVIQDAYPDPPRENLKVRVETFAQRPRWVRSMAFPHRSQGFLSSSPLCTRAAHSGIEACVMRFLLQPIAASAHDDSLSHGD
jgi:hypothetical protein